MLYNWRLREFELMSPEMTASASNLQIIYSPSGLGYAGNPNGPDLAPLVTVQLSGLTFRPIVALALANVGLPQIRSSLTFEDGVGTTSN